MTREEWERRLYEKLAGWVWDALYNKSAGMLRTRWQEECREDLKRTIHFAYDQIIVEPPPPTPEKK